MINGVLCAIGAKHASNGGELMMKSDNLANKYRPKTWEDVTEQPVVVNMLKSMCESDDLVNRNFLLTGPAGCGKASPLDTHILTTSGWKELGDTKLGDEVYTAQGHVGKIIAQFMFASQPIYDLIFDDGSSLRVAKNHNNCIYVKRFDDNKMEYIDAISTDYLVAIFNRLDVEVYIDNPARFISVSELNKYSELYPVPTAEYRRLVDICYLGDDSCMCIYIDHPDHTYIADYFIPTHNTTLCRIMADVLNKGEGSPIEIDAASNSGIDSMREIVKQARLYPIGSKYKIFIIDEVHALSSAAWQALLLPIEAGVGNTIFMFATTNPEKIPATIISRVQVFQLSKISLSGIQNRLIKVLDSEIAEGRQITYDPAAVNYVAKLAQGGMRDALTLLDKALAYSPNITSDSIAVALNIPKYDEYFELLNAYVRKDNAVISTIVDRVYNSGVNFIRWFEGWHAFVINIVKFIFLRDINKTMIPVQYETQISKYTDAHAMVCLKLANRLVTMLHELKSTSYLQETALTYLCNWSINR